MEGGESGHEPPQLEHDVLYVLVVQQFQLHQDIGSQFGEALPGVRATSEDETKEQTHSGSFCDTFQTSM